MSFITNLFAPKKPAPFAATATPDYRFNDDTTKLVGKPLSVIYGENVHVTGNVVHRRLSTDRKNIKQAVALCWGPVTIHADSIRINEKRPEYINGIINPNRSLEPGFISGVKVWPHSGTLGQAAAHDLEYGLNRTAYIWVEASANDNLNTITSVECEVSRGPLFVEGTGYNTPLPGAIGIAFPNGIPSWNPMAAALNYLLNKDYGPGRDEAHFGNFSTWIANINHCAELIEVTRETTTAWQALVGCTVDVTGNIVTKTGSNFAWNAGAFSRSSLDPDEDNYVTFEAGAFSSNPQSYTTTSCQWVQVNQGAEGGVADVYQCTQTPNSRDRKEGNIIGLSSANIGEGYASIEYGIHLRVDGKWEIIESGSRVRNSGSDPDPLETAGTYWGDGSADSQFVWGTYVAGDEFQIGYEGGDVVYYKNGVLQYTSTVASTDELFVDTSMFKTGGTFEITAFDGTEYEPRWRIEQEIGNEANSTHNDNIEAILALCFGSYFSSNGVIKSFCAKATAPLSVTLDRSNFTPKGSSLRDMMEIPNVVEIEYKSDENGGEKQSAIYENVTQIGEWGEIRDDRQMHGIPTRTQASRAATLIGRQASAEKMVISGTADQKFMNLEPGDVVLVTMGYDDSIWFTDKKFWVDKIDSDDKDGDVYLELLEYGGDTIYDDSASTSVDENDTVNPPDPTTRLPDPNSAPEPPTDIEAEIGFVPMAPTRRYYIDLSWEYPEQPDYMHNKFLIYRRTTLDDDWVHIATLSGKTNSYRDFASDIVNESYLYAIVSETITGKVGDMPDDYSIFVEALAQDSPDPVSNVRCTLLPDSRLQIDWNYATYPVDFKDFLVFVRLASNPTEDVNPLYGGVTTRTTKTDAASTPEDYIIEVVARDTFGNRSVGVTQTFTMTAPPAIRSIGVSKRSDNSYLFNWTPNGTVPVNFAGYRLMYNLENSINPENSFDLSGGLINGTTYQAPTLIVGEVSVIVFMEDTAGNIGDVARVTITSVSPELDNVIEEFDFRTGAFLDPDQAWPSNSEDMYPNDDADPMYHGSAGDYIYTGYQGATIIDGDLVANVSEQMVYRTIEITLPQGGRVTTEIDITAPSYTIEFMSPFNGTMYTEGGNPMYPGGGGSTAMFGSDNAFTTWPGEIEGYTGQRLVFRITVLPSTEDVILREFKVFVDVPDVREILEDVEISDSGDRLVLTKSYTVIKNVYLTTLYDGGTAISSRLVDKSATLGPLVEMVNASGTLVAGTLNAEIVGYNVE